MQELLRFQQFLRSLLNQPLQPHLIIEILQRQLLLLDGLIHRDEQLIDMVGFRR